MVLNNIIYKACKQKRALKSIIGIGNFKLADIVPKLKASEVAGATYVDIAASEQIVYELKNITSLPLCVSSIDIDELVSCYHAGADMLEVGNFDIFYNQDINFSQKQIIDLTKELISKVPNASICVTIPHKLKMMEQLALGQRLEKLGVDMIQTEGISSKLNSNIGLCGSMQSASATLSSTAILSTYLNIPIICSSGMNSLNAPIAISCGASAVGVGSFFNNFTSLLDLSKEINSMVYSMENTQYLHYAIEDSSLHYANVDTSNILCQI
uniref:Uncharacterized protein ycf23 n=1 Tax=Liagoropsis maxima TaxID=1653392 RepID=A0A1G4NVU2_9FLOR|nr:Hypothetical protein ycf23 [Liagoropsis maxima]SCW22734.1 Hypothetical protein ycf23 [Liagoropsis maxima]